VRRGSACATNSASRLDVNRARENNVFDKHYATAGALAENPFVGAGNAFEEDPDEWRSERFVAPGAPRAGWIGVRYRWGT